MQEGVPSAEYGRTSGGVVSYITRSGSNDLHGNAAGFLRNTVLDARPYNSATVPRDQQWEMELSAGGPVWIPKVYNGRDKTFFFFNLTTFRQPPTAGPGTVTAPRHRSAPATSPTSLSPSSIRPRAYSFRETSSPRADRRHSGISEQALSSADQLQPRQ